MRLDRTRIAIRQRPFAEILDLALRVCREHALQLVLLLIVGALPLAAANYVVLTQGDDGFSAEQMVNPDAVLTALYVNVLLVLWQIPLATAPITLYLGRTLFEDQISLRRGAWELLASLPQLIVFQVVLRGLMTLVCIALLLPYGAWPYLNEVILLERNPIFSKRKTGTTTARRARTLHGHHSGELFARAMVSAGLGVAASLSLWGTLVGSRVLMTGIWDRDDPTNITVLLPLALWTTAAFFAVVRFLCYVDLRTRNEGWEVELCLRAEAARLERQFT